MDRAVGWDAAEFADQFVETVGEDVSVAMCTQGEANGAFVIAELCDTIHREGKSKLGKTVKGWFGSDGLKQVEQGKAKGRRVLLEKLALL